MQLFVATFHDTHRNRITGEIESRCTLTHIQEPPTTGGVIVALDPEELRALQNLLTPDY